MDITVTGFTLTIPMELADMPAHPVRFSKSDMIPSSATMEVEIKDGEPVFRRIELMGMKALKAGGPSKAPISDNYWSTNTLVDGKWVSRGAVGDDTPLSVQEVIVKGLSFARALLHG